MLGLSGIVLVKRVGHVEGRPRRLEVQMERTGPRVGVHAIEQREAVAAAVQGLQFRRIQVSIRAETADGKEVADRGRSAPDAGIHAGGLERSKAETDITSR